MLASLRFFVARVGRWPRLLAAGAFVLLAVLSAVTSAHDRAAARRPEPVDPVLVAVRLLGAGQVVHTGDVRLERWPTALSPPGALRSVRAVVGRRVAGPVGVREPLTASRLVGAGLTAGLDRGMGAVSVDVAGAQAQTLLHAGDLVDVLSSPGTSTDATSGLTSGAPVSVVVSDAVTLAVLHGADAGTSTVVIAADRATALRVARAASTGSFTIVVVSS